MTKDEQIAKTVAQRMGDYSSRNVVEDRKRLIDMWREAHPEAAAQAPSEAHRPLIQTGHRKRNDDEPDEVWVNDIYQVTLRRRPDKVFGSKGMIHLGINTHDGTARHDWREMQWIKNQLVGPECEAFELYPAESRLLDPSNYYSLWCFPHIHRLKLGVNEDRRVWDADQAMAPQRGLPK